VKEYFNERLLVKYSFVCVLPASRLFGGWLNAWAAQDR
jgi:hypothetical protein